MALSGAQGVTLSVRLSGTSLSKALKLHLFSQRSVSDLSKVSLGSSSGHPQVSLRSVSGQSQVSLRSFSGLSMSTLSDRWSLKYFVLFTGAVLLLLSCLKGGGLVVAHVILKSAQVLWTLNFRTSD